MTRRAQQRGSQRSRPGTAEVLYEDDQLLIANKPAGMPTIAERSDTRRPLLDAIIDHARSNADSSVRVRPVNLLEPSVSGLVVFAKAKRVESALESLFRRNRVRRTYAAVLEGPLDAEEGTTGTIQSTEKPARQRGPRRDAPPPPTPAVTHYRVLKKSAKVTLVQFRPETHRRNQMLEHARQLGHPIIGEETGKQRRGQPPLMLHLEQIVFEHPRTGRDVRVIAPRPAEFDRAFRDTPRQAKQKEPTESDTSWQSVAEWYGTYQTTDRSDHFTDVIHPGALDLLGDVRDRRVLDVACGEGTFASILISRGASVVGVDAADDLIKQARAKSIPRATFVAADASRLSDAGPQTHGPFDAATCIMALMNLADLDATLVCIAARLTTGAPFVAVTLHPAFRSPRQTSWGWDARGRGQQRQYRRVDAYLSESRTPITMNPGKAARGERPIETWTFHRPITAYKRAVNAAGIVIGANEEWARRRQNEAGPRADEENRARAEIPLFLGIRAIRSERKR